MNGPALVTPYAGQTQQQQIQVPAPIAYKYIDSEEGPWSMMPYQEIFPDVLNDQFPPPPAPQFLPPPLKKTDLWRAMQTWPL